MSTFGEMNKSNSDSSWLAITLDRRVSQPLQAQLAEGIRRLVREGRLGSGDRLPASRLLAGELSVSRLTVVTAYDQLVSEGYLVGRRGAGMFIAPELSALPQPPLAPEETQPLPRPEPLRAFDSAAPDVTGFPHRHWARLFDQVWRAPEPALLARIDPLGWAPLRTAIAQHLRDWRGIRCAPSQIVITSGLREAVELVSRTALEPGDCVAVEEPGHALLRSAFAETGLTVRPVAVDADGFDPELLGDEIRAVAVTPSRQFPLGMTLPLARRLRLLGWAAETGGWVIEDDFDGEYRYRGQPLPAMMSLDEAGRVIYAGSFSKVMFSGLRLGFLAIPAALEGPTRHLVTQRGAQAALVAQPVLARFMEEGLFSTHLRRMRRLYAQRQRAMVAALERRCEGLLAVEDVPSGMHLVAGLAPELARRISDVEASERCAAVGLRMRPLSGFFAGAPTRQGLVLGFAAFNEVEIDESVARMAAVLRG
ncbi:PLP-dependent aminotransferase family protein [Tropicimonas sp. TH_r6]|uniref:MocR-like pyridoxine biosynthesis transcription factor PdxR n=1 Tax=Tropicimonas sp. TH_r6 TaxID=3082085 RepID=UPI0029529FF6|nr:PLP-dependent aminotransferase family protein [Tropicimonas sp. TH_r6]MDV7144641.1 PLP-dependent aminotransferase family protein [Tropicimonas sp. TH_r6]